jgi:hypothetical protein
VAVFEVPVMSQQTPSTLTPLNMPRPLAITVDKEGIPAAVQHNGRIVTVTEVLDCWRIDDEWWREEISRRYYHLQLDDGRRLTVFADLIAGGWYMQRYSAVPTPAAANASTGKPRTRKL